jgi:hypothetical protein
VPARRRRELEFDELEQHGPDGRLRAMRQGVAAGAPGVASCIAASLRDALRLIRHPRAIAVQGVGGAPYHTIPYHARRGILGSVRQHEVDGALATASTRAVDDRMAAPGSTIAAMAATATLHSLPHAADSERTH